MYADHDRMPGYNPEFLKKLRAKQEGEHKRERAKVLSRNLRGSDSQIRARVEKATAIQEAVKREFEQARGIKTEAERILAKAKAEAASILVDAEKRSAEILARAGLADSRSAMEVICAVAGKHSVAVADITGRSMRADIVAVRHEAIARVYAAFPQLSLPKIAKIFGGRDHTSIMHVANKMGAYRTGPRSSLPISRPHQERKPCARHW